MKNKYKIFDKIVELNINSKLNSNQVKDIYESLSLYQKENVQSEPDIIIKFEDKLSCNVLSSNPSIHKECKNGFIIYNKKITIYQEFNNNDKLTYTVVVDKLSNYFSQLLKRINNMQHSTINERLSQVIFEQILVPAVYFNKTQFLVHASAFTNPQSKAILIGGTGGCGKTSLEIELCSNRGYKFIADDISVVSEEGVVYPNLNFPKIYGYNLNGNDKLKKKIFYDLSFINKMSWHLRYKILGPDSVRRKISPLQAFGNYEKEDAIISKYFILVKENRNDIYVEKIDAEIAANLTISVMQTEYSLYNNHLLWHEFYSNIKKNKPIITMEEVLLRWKKSSFKTFSKIDCFAVFIPFNISHKQFISQASEIIMKY